MITTYIDIDGEKAVVKFNIEVQADQDTVTTNFFIKSVVFVNSGLALMESEFHWVADMLYEELSEAKRYGEIPYFDWSGALELAEDSYERGIAAYFSSAPSK